MFRDQKLFVTLLPEIQAQSNKIRDHRRTLVIFLELCLKKTIQSIPLRHRQVSARLTFPRAGVVNKLLGSDSHVTLPLNLRMYLYWMSVFAGRLTATIRSFMSGYEGTSYYIMETYCSRSDNLQKSGVARCPATSL
jgi:hypothetical protein